jgi:hypothetical protein
MRTIFLVALAAGIIAVTLIVIVVSTIPTKDYDLSVDALKDEQSLFTNARVVIKNTGKLPLTNILVDYGTEKEPLIPVLRPGETMSLSPPEGTLLDTVTVTAEPDIMKVQEYRAPIKLPGMIGS